MMERVRILGGRNDRWRCSNHYPIQCLPKVRRNVMWQMQIKVKGTAAKCNRECNRDGRRGVNMSGARRRTFSAPSLRQAASCDLRPHRGNSGLWVVAVNLGSQRRRSTTSPRRSSYGMPSTLASPKMICCRLRQL